MANERCGGSLDMCSVIGDVVTHWRCAGSLKMGWLIGDVLVRWR